MAFANFIKFFYEAAPLRRSSVGRRFAMLAIYGCFMIDVKSAEGQVAICKRVSVALTSRASVSSPSATLAMCKEAMDVVSPSSLYTDCSCCLMKLFKVFVAIDPSVAAIVLRLVISCFFILGFE